MRIKNEKDFYSGLMFMAVGVAFAWGATTYSVGTGARMGPGYFPLVLGVVLALLGAAITFVAVTVETETGEKVGAFAWKPAICIIGANLAFGVCLGGLKVAGATIIPSMGMVIGIFALVMISSLAAEVYRLKEVLGLATVLALGCYVTFIKLLKLQIPVWPSFLS
jgi:hypothetical protein